MPKLKHIAKANSIKTISPPIFISPIDRRKALVEKLKVKQNNMDKIDNKTLVKHATH